ncbi:MAG: hypothetical protein KKF41_08565 [Actinobacteria bacterium]|nr:hypothetical protein [Actinomycetota bacterium]MBU1942894.1 hypothetical protein [Actinomycetota bacterium]MBU2687626.1 hypothetical protein [Actinomycetota bacterium]
MTERQRLEKKRQTAWEGALKAEAKLDQAQGAGADEKKIDALAQTVAGLRAQAESLTRLIKKAEEAEVAEANRAKLDRIEEHTRTLDSQIQPLSENMEYLLDGSRDGPLARMTQTLRCYYQGGDRDFSQDEVNRIPKDLDNLFREIKKLVTPIDLQGYGSVEHLRQALINERQNLINETKPPSPPRPVNAYDIAQKHGTVRYDKDGNPMNLEKPDWCDADEIPIIPQGAM